MMEWVAQVGAKHQICAQRGAFLVFQKGRGGQGNMFDKRGRAANVSNTKKAPLGTFVVFDTKGRAGNVSRGRAENMLNIKNMPTRAYSWCPTREEWRECAEHDKHALVVFDTRERMHQTSEHVLGGRVIVFETSRRAGGKCSRRGEGEGTC